MEYKAALTVASFLFGTIFGNAVAVDCGIGWTSYKDETCLKLFPNEYLPWKDAQEFCESTAPAHLDPSLPLIMEPEYQDYILKEFIVNEDIMDFVWLGLKLDESRGDFFWRDGKEILYQNWASGHPRQVDDVDRCAEMRPPNNLLQSPSYWYDVGCRKRNIVLCQKKPNWSIDEIVKEVIEIRKQIIPIGFIYVQHPSGQPPSEIWPALKWIDVSSESAGLFFRVAGGSAAPWGGIQEDCSPRISAAETALNDWPYNYVDIPRSGWSGWFRTGQYGGHMNGYIPSRTRLHSKDCEVRPRNIAVKLWKRTL